MIELDGVSKSFGGVQALDRVSCTVQDGEVSVLIGPSGCGKSTTIRLINRIIAPDAGRILLQGSPVSEYRPEELRRRIGYVIQSVGLFPHMTVAENVGIVPRLMKWDRNRTQTRVGELLELIGLPPDGYLEKYPHELSGGEAQRVGVARALAADPPVLLMDEPFGAVDPLNRQVLQREFLRIQDELQKTVLFVTHDLDEAIRLADRLILMRDGRIVQEDTPKNVLERPKNGFVRQFVGTDRALKRLSRIPVREYMEAATTVTLDSGKLRDDEHWRRAASTSDGYAWVVDADGRLLGWVYTADVNERSDVEQQMTEVDRDECSVAENMDIRQALARLLAENVGRLPVLDEDGHVIGEVGMPEVLEASGQDTRAAREDVGDGA